MAYFVLIKARWVHELVESLESNYFVRDWPTSPWAILWRDELPPGPSMVIRSALDPIDVVAAALIFEMRTDLFMEAVT